ncbi:MAG: OmpA family protein [Burkholderiaceae bacterium]|jgi:peptidoglycan-associated lipoprotein|nr:OmpA family protein [Burkholderiaceae bacterium]
MSPRPSYLSRALAAVVLPVVLLALSGCIIKRYEWVEVGPPVRHAEVPSLPASAPEVALEPTPVEAPAPSATDFVAAGDLVFFDTDLAALDTEAQNTLNRQAEWLSRYPQTSIRVEGNADWRASAQYNLDLGQRRADAVKDYLVSRGIDASRITTASNGYWKPIASGKSAESLAFNRNARSILIIAAGQ